MAQVRFHFARLFIAVAFFACLAVAQAASAQAPQDETERQLQAAGRAAGYAQASDPRIIVAIRIRQMLGLVGIVMVIINIYAGFKWMTAGGNEEAIEHSKKLIRNAVIGLIIVLTAYAITIAATNLAFGRSLSTGAGSGARLEDLFR